ncbi:MAG: hypothetical protein KF903_03680 [Dokdonella sp.]|uniref:beta-lactamase hydrolase domain-containing protein n=1 Tax=Dokdonella sp. TaxID=2291710 RepID=UPI0025BB3CBE|nr:sulfur transferase domain-containing protein [Dokdonella sp.]MBX3700084.1 hypothetical protein [Dokdonella sp.]MCW5577874.1 hypothetical protein [Dokdonella sp.]
MSRRLANIALCAALLALAGCAHAPASTTRSELKLQQPLPGLFTAGQPAPTDWAAIRARGVRTVINLRPAQELAGRDEAAEVRAAGMEYLEIPVAGADGVTVANAQRLHDALQPRHAGVLVHCASGNRVGGLLALEQADFDGMAPQAALDLGRAAGMTGTEPRVRQMLGIAH